MRPRRATQPLDLNAAAPRLAWAELYARLARSDAPEGFQQGDHVAIVGPTGTGKTHIALQLAELRSYVLVVACKPKDPLIEDARRHGYHVVGREALTKRGKLELPYAEGRPLHKRVVFWPRSSERATQGDMTKEKKLQRPAVKEALSYVRRNGSWCLVIDEGTWVCRDLKLQTDIDGALNTFRTLHASIIILGQRPSWMGQYVMSQPTHLFLFKTRHGDDIKRLGDISGVDFYAVREIIPQLDRPSYECLYLNARTEEMYRVIAPPR